MSKERSVSSDRVIHVHQGECRVAEDSAVMLTTVLGSCIAACLRDDEARVGGMNHFLLPDSQAADRATSMRYGAYAMEVLVNGLLSIGAKRERLEAKLFGGGCLADGLADIGGKNASFAEDYLKREGIMLLGGSVRGQHARRVQFWPVSGRVRQLALTRTRVVPVTVPVRLPDDHGSVELF
jgi:chemotaxis protein CheD